MATTLEDRRLLTTADDYAKLQSDLIDGECSWKIEILKSLVRNSRKYKGSARSRKACSNGP